MKKRQKVLLGLMALGLVGGIGSAVALTRTAAEQKNTSLGTDKAVYLYWDENTTAKNSIAEVENLTANSTEYRYIVVAPKMSKTLEGTVSITFTLSVDSSRNQELAGLTVDITENSSADKNGTAVVNGYTGSLNLTETGKNTATATFDVNGASDAAPTKYYKIGFTWDGTSVSDGKTFGGSLGISQSFAEKVANA